MREQTCVTSAVEVYREICLLNPPRPPGKTVDKKKKLYQDQNATLPELTLDSKFLRNFSRMRLRNHNIENSRKKTSLLSVNQTFEVFFDTLDDYFDYYFYNDKKHLNTPSMIPLNTSASFLGFSRLSLLSMPWKIP